MMAMPTVVYPAADHIRVYGMAGTEFQLTRSTINNSTATPAQKYNGGTILVGNSYIDIPYKTTGTSGSFPTSVGAYRLIGLQVRIGVGYWKTIAMMKVTCTASGVYRMDYLESWNDMVTVDDARISTHQPVVIFDGYNVGVHAPAGNTYTLKVATSLTGAQSVVNSTTVGDSSTISYFNFIPKVPTTINHVWYYFLYDQNGTEVASFRINCVSDGGTTDYSMRIFNLVAKNGAVLHPESNSAKNRPVISHFADSTNSIMVTTKAPGIYSEQFRYRVTDQTGTLYSGPVTINGVAQTVTRGEFTLRRDETAVLTRDPSMIYTVKQVSQPGYAQVTRLILNNSLIRDTLSTKVITVPAGTGGAHAIFVNAVPSGDSSGTNGGAQVEKRAWRTSNTAPYQYEMELLLKGKSAGESGYGGMVDVLLVVDASSSMSSSTLPGSSKKRWELTREVAADMASAILAGNPNSRVAIVTYSNASYIRETWTNDSGLPGRIRVMTNNGGGTSYPEGFKGAVDMMASSNPNANRFVIYMSDGESTEQGIIENNYAAAFDLLRHYPDARIFTVGIGGSVDSAVLNPGGVNRYNDAYYHAVQAQDLIDIFDEFTSILTLTFDHPSVIDILSNNVSLVGGQSAIKGWYCDNSADGHIHSSACWTAIDDTIAWNSGSKTIDWKLKTRNSGTPRLDNWVTYRLTYPVQVTNASEAYADMGDPGTGTHAGEEGWYSNNEAVLKTKDTEVMFFPMPVVRNKYSSRNSSMTIVVTGESDVPLENAVFVVKDSEGNILYGSGDQLKTGPDGSVIFDYSLIWVCT